MRAREALLVRAFALGTLMVGTTAHAQDESAEESESEPASPEEEPGAETEAATDEPTDSADQEDPTGPSGKEEDAELVADAEAGNSPVELPGKSYQFVGLRYRGIVVPKFMMNLFGDGGKTVYVHAFGPEFIVRKDAFEYNLSLWYAGYGMEPTPFKAKDDGNDAWELVESKIKVIFITADFLWSNEFTPEFSLNYGLGAGLGIVFGDLIREQAYPGPGDDIDDPYEWDPCAGPGSHGYCADPDNEGHFQGYTEPSWANGGSKPVVFPWLAIQTGLRYKPHRNFVARFDVGFGTSGFFFGLGADYGL